MLCIFVYVSSRRVRESNIKCCPRGGIVWEKLAQNWPPSTAAPLPAVVAMKNQTWSELSTLHKTRRKTLES